MENWRKGCACFVACLALTGCPGMERGAVDAKVDVKPKVKVKATMDIKPKVTATVDIEPKVDVASPKIVDEISIKRKVVSDVGQTATGGGVNVGTVVLEGGAVVAVVSGLVVLVGIAAFLYLRGRKRVLALDACIRSVEHSAKKGYDIQGLKAEIAVQSEDNGIDKYLHKRVQKVTNGRGGVPNIPKPPPPPERKKKWLA